MRTIINLNGAPDVIDIEFLRESLREIYINLDEDSSKQLTIVDISKIQNTIQECNDALISLTRYADYDRKKIDHLERSLYKQSIELADRVDEVKMLSLEVESLTDKIEELEIAKQKVEKEFEKANIERTKACALYGQALEKIEKMEKMKKRVKKAIKDSNVEE